MTIDIWEIVVEQEAEGITRYFKHDAAMSGKIVDIVEVYYGLGCCRMRLSR